MAHPPARHPAVTRGIKAFLLACALIGAWPRPRRRAAGPHGDSQRRRGGRSTESPATPRTAAILGDERLGSGIVIDGTGLVVTIGYLILEATDTWIRTGGGQRVPADILAYDHETGFGLLRAQAPLDKVVPMALGDSDALVEGTPAVIASFGGPGVTATRGDGVPARFRGILGVPAGECDLHQSAAPVLRGRGARCRPAAGSSGSAPSSSPTPPPNPLPAPGNMFVPVAQLKSGARRPHRVRPIGEPPEAMARGLRRRERRRPGRRVEPRRRAVRHAAGRHRAGRRHRLGRRCPRARARRLLPQAVERPRARRHA